MKKIISIIIALMVVFLIGGCSKMTGTPSKEEMIKVVKSEEGEKAVEETLKKLDKDALTEKGVIKNYEVDYDSVKHNPMGGIMFDVVINNDRELIVSSILSKDTQLKIGSWSPSIKLEALLGL
ncbi:DUF1310 family protein [Gemella morbillorum]|uniref:DUF1310 family protein n=1 Tax=Gemella morbillorum TaxID=29391 RepID=UPI0028D8805C|nr:DUF1310 family protein [Gemella morbillorum]